MQETDAVFNDKDGYIVLNMADAEKLVPRLNGLVEVASRSGDKFIELLIE
jgi:hypothetical protein